MTARSENSTFSQDMIDDVTLSLAVDNSSKSSIPEGCVEKLVSQFIPWDNEHNLIPKQVDVIVNLLFMGILLPLFFIISFSTNVVSMVVFYKQGLKERINMCLFSLSLLDILYVATIYGYNSDVVYMFAIGKGDQIGSSAIFYVQNYLTGVLGLQNASQVVSTVIALERCLCVTRPLLVKSFMSTKKTAMVMWSLLLIIIGGTFVSSGLRYDLICVFDARDGSTSYHFYTSQFYAQNQNIMHIFGGLIYGLLLPGFCMICVTVCTVVTAVKMKNVSQWRETVSSASKSLSLRGLAVTRMVVGTSVLFIVCTVPTISDRVSEVIIPDLRTGGRYDNLNSVFIKTSMLTSVINSSVNFFVYYFFGSKFRQIVYELFISCTKLKKEREKKESRPRQL